MHQIENLLLYLKLAKKFYRYILRSHGLITNPTEGHKREPPLPPPLIKGGEGRGRGGRRES
jgi:hypothetical protein